MQEARSAPLSLQAVGVLQRIARLVARFLADYDVWLTPTLAEPPVPLGTFDSHRGIHCRASIGRLSSLLLRLSATTLDSPPCRYRSSGTAMHYLLVPTSSGASVMRRPSSASLRSLRKRGHGLTVGHQDQPEPISADGLDEWWVPLLAACSTMLLCEPEFYNQSPRLQTADAIQVARNLDVRMLLFSPRCHFMSTS